MLLKRSEISLLIWGAFMTLLDFIEIPDKQNIEWRHAFVLLRNMLFVGITGLYGCMLLYWTRSEAHDLILWSAKSAPCPNPHLLDDICQRTSKQE